MLNQSIDEDSEQNKTHQRMKILIFVWYFRVLFYLIALFCFASVVHWLACRPGTKETLDSPSSQGNLDYAIEEIRK